MRRTSLMFLMALAGFALPVVASSAQVVDRAEDKPAQIKVLVAAQAEVFFDGFKTKQTGQEREFVSPPLPRGQLFKYSVKATWRASGKEVALEKEVRIRAGQESIVDLRPEPEKKLEKKMPAVVDPEKKDLDRTPDVVYWPTPQEVVDKMLDLAQVKKGDVVYDLGCGDARILVTAAKKYQCKGFGFDIDPERIKDSNENVRRNHVENLVTIQRKDIFTLDLRDANVVTLYLLPDLNVKLMPQLEKLKPGSRIVSHDFDMRGAKPKKVVHMKAVNHMGQEGEHTIYLWIVPWEKE